MKAPASPPVFDSMRSAVPPGFRGINVVNDGPAEDVPEPAGLPVPLAAVCASGHRWGTIERGFVYCDVPGCGTRKPISDDEAADFIWGAG